MSLEKWILGILVGIIVAPIAYVAMDIIAGENIQLVYKLLFILIVPLVLVAYAVFDIKK